jgi:hypothetical protein
MIELGIDLRKAIRNIIFFVGDFQPKHNTVAVINDQFTRTKQ